MNTPETQEVTTTVDVGRDAFASIMVPLQAASSQRPRTEAPVASEQPQQQPATTLEAEVKPETPPQATPAAPVEGAVAAVKAEQEPPADPYASVVSSAFSTQEQKVEWTPEMKEAFKATFGAEDPAAYKADIESKLTESELLKAEYEKVRPALTALESMPPALAKAFQLSMEGKPDEAQSYLRDLPTPLLLNKEASKMSDRELIDTYLPGKMKPEQWGTLDDDDADPDVVDALKTKIGILRDSAMSIHEQKRGEILQSKAAEEAARNQQYEAYKVGVASSISAAKASPYGVLLDSGTQEKISSGAFLSDFVMQDGVTPTPQAATLYLLATHGEKLMKAAEASGYVRGKNEGSLEATSRQPVNPPAQSRAVTGPPPDATPNDEVRNILWNVLSS